MDNITIKSDLGRWQIFDLSFLRKGSNNFRKFGFEREKWTRFWNQEEKNRSNHRVHRVELEFISLTVGEKGFEHITQRRRGKVFRLKP